MTDKNITTTTNMNDEFMNDDDFVFTKDENGNVVGGGYKIKSYFLQGGIPVMTTYNDTNEQNGGKVSSPFENLAVPAGLFYVNMRVPKKEFENKSDYHYKPHEMASDEIMDKLYALVEVDKKKKRKTRKNNIKVTNLKNKPKTRRHK